VRPFSHLAHHRLFEDNGMILVGIHGCTAGRGAIERMLAKLIASFLPNTYRAVARRAA
jgi:hypothetical protein